MMRPLKNRAEVAVIGGGLAGLSAARHAAGLGRLVTLFEGSGIFGGQVATVGHVEGLPVPGDFSGQDLAVHLLEECRKAGVRILETGVERLDSGEGLRILDTNGRGFGPEAIIVASGASPRKLAVPGEDEFLGRGVSRCATCDGGFFRGEDVVVVGGGDAAFQEALVLSQFCRRVIMVCRSPLKARREYIDRLAARDNVTFVWDSEVTEILGNDAVHGIRLRNIRNGEVSTKECAAVFPFVGAVPNSEYLPASLLTESGHVRVNRRYGTADPRIFAVGAMREGYGGQLVQAMADGVGAADSACRLLS